jgi:hypothetical protein
MTYEEDEERGGQAVGEGVDEVGQDQAAERGVAEDRAHALAP